MYKIEDTSDPWHVPGRSQTSSSNPTPRSSPTPKRRLVANIGNESSSGPPRHATNASLRSSHVLHHVHPVPSGKIPLASVHDNSLLVARQRLDLEGHREEARYPRGRDDQGQALHTKRGRVPRCVRERAYGADQR